MEQILGLHHISALASDPVRNLEFYQGVLGLRLVKTTVNYEYPQQPHLYYGDGLGTPGTVLSFFPGSTQAPQRGVGQVGLVRLALPQESMGYWTHRLLALGVRYTVPHQRRMALQDPDGLRLEMVFDSAVPKVVPVRGSPVPPQYAIKGLYNAQLWLRQAQPTQNFLAQIGISNPEAQGLELREVGDFILGQDGPGVVHHLALTTPDLASLTAFKQHLMQLGVPSSAIKDRTYFHSVYFREPGGVLLEVATRIPGFTADEDPETLGQSLRLPRWLENSGMALEFTWPR